MNKSNRVLVKIGGAALADPSALANVTTVVQRYREQGQDVVLVHGGGPAINEALRAKGIEWTFVGGQRVTTSAMMKVIEDTLCGQVNGRIVRHFGVEGLAAVGFSGADHRTLLCSAQSAELGLVGQIESVDTSWIENILAMPSKPLPVIAPIGAGAKGETYNINADRAAAFLGASLKVDELVFLTDQPGIYDEEGQIIALVDRQGLKNLIEARIVTGGMLAKAQAIIHALEEGVAVVKITNAQDDAGTRCLLQLDDTHVERPQMEDLRHVAI